VVDGPENIFVVMQYAAGGSLLDYVRTRKRLHEREARHFLGQMCQALQYCHGCQVSAVEETGGPGRYDATAGFYHHVVEPHPSYLLSVHSLSPVSQRSGVVNTERG
jgi:serine/threonine protein kinase